METKAWGVFIDIEAAEDIRRALEVPGLSSYVVHVCILFTFRSVAAATTTATIGVTWRIADPFEAWFPVRRT